MNTEKKSNIIDYLKQRNFKKFSLFFIVAFVFLIFSKLSNDYKQTIQLKIILENVEDEILFNTDSSNYIKAYVQAKGFTLVPLLFKPSKDVVINAESEATQKADYFLLDVQKNKFLIEDQLGSSYDLISLKPDSLFIGYSKRASKKVPIALSHHINYAVGYDLKDNFKINRDSVKIVGSEYEVEQIDSIITETLELKNVNSNIRESLKLDISNYENIEIFPKYITVSGEVTRFTEGTIEVPLTIINQPKDITINYFPKTVSLSYYVNLENYNDVKELDFKVECDYSELEDLQTFLIPKVVMKPEFVKHVNIRQKRIDFIEL